MRIRSRFRSCRRGFVRAAALATLVCAFGCNEAEQQARREAGVLSHAIDGVRKADNAVKARALGALRSAPCSHPDVCRVRSACLRAYELHVSSVESAVEAGRHIDGGSPERAAAALVNAERDLKRSAELAAECTDLQGELVRKFKL